MMMVDTINPNTDQPDSFTGAAKQQEPVNTQADHFYGGFDKPDDVKINLASSVSTPSDIVNEPVASVPDPVQPGVSMDQIAPVAAPEETKIHQSYSKHSPANTRGVVMIVLSGLVATLIFGVVSYFIVGSVNNKKLEEQQAQLDTLNKELAVLNEAPDPLQPEVTEETDTTEDTTTEETTTVIPDTTEEIQTTDTEVLEEEQNENGQTVVVGADG